MITIHKYQFKINDHVEIEMPVNSKILSVQVQNGMPTMWVKVDTDLMKAIRMFKIYGTGHEMNSLFEYDHIATIQYNGFVWHIFE